MNLNEVHREPLKGIEKGNKFASKTKDLSCKGSN